MAFVESVEALSVQKYRALGAAQILTLHRQDNMFRRWRLRSHNAPELQETLRLDTIGTVIRSHSADWNPQSVLRAKTFAFATTPSQLDFADAGLIAALESELRPKLDNLLKNALTRGQAAYQEQRTSKMPEQEIASLYRLVFRLLAAKMLIDRGDKPDWIDLDVATILSQVVQVYPDLSNPQAVLQDRRVQQAVWQVFSDGLRLQNLSVETLAYQYEHTLVEEDVRRRQAIHATPPEVAEFMVRHLPLDKLLEGERRIFEPFCGHAPFLIAGMGRLRELPTSNKSSSEWHDYFKRMLSGMEEETFAREIALYSLILADYPNPNGWTVIEADAFYDERFDKMLGEASAVLCNPPYGTWANLNRSRPLPDALDYAEAEALRRVLKHAPPILGFVLPRTLLNHKESFDLQKTLEETYRDISIVALPDTIFKHSRAEVILLLAHNLNASSRRYFFARVQSTDKEAFLRSGMFTETYETDTLRSGNSDKLVFWQTPRQPVWDALAVLPTLSNISTLTKGIEYTSDPKLYVSDTPVAGYAAGVPIIKGFLEPYAVQKSKYLSLDPRTIIGDKINRPWSSRKVLLNRARVSIDVWCLAGAVDTTGLYATRQFYGVWPKDDLPVEVLAAVLNGPVASAFVFDHRVGLDNYPRDLNQIPVPQFMPEQIELIVSLVDEYRSCREWLRLEPERSVTLEPRCRSLLLQIDAAVLDAYNLTPEQETLLLSLFDGVRRPLLPFDFTGYGTEEFALVKQAVAAKRYWKTIITRYHALVDKEFEGGLTEEESAEQERLADEIDAEESRENQTILAALPTNLR